MKNKIQCKQKKKKKKFDLKNHAQDQFCDNLFCVNLQTCRIHYDDRHKIFFSNKYHLKFSSF